MARVAIVVLMSAALLFSCGADESATLAIKVRPPVARHSVLRRFPPAEPLPDRVRVEVHRSDDILGKAVSALDVAWSDLEEDSTTHQKYLLINVPANEDKDYLYLLRLSSVVNGQVDECAAIGQILAVKGAKKQLDIVTHQGDCSGVLCQSDSDCNGTQYCLSFECQAGDPTCNCPEGAYCNEQNECAAACSATDNPCTNDYPCCAGICSIHCPES